jgi:hypothetical protein
MNSPLPPSSPLRGLSPLSSLCTHIRECITPIRLFDEEDLFRDSDWEDFEGATLRNDNSPTNLHELDGEDDIPLDILGHRHGSSLPAPSSSDPDASSPIRGRTKAQRSEQRLKKGFKKRKITLAKQKEDTASLIALKKRRDLDDILQQLKAKGLWFNDLMVHVFDPVNGNRGDVRWHDFFASYGNATQILDWWTHTKNSPLARNEVHEWAVGYMLNTIAHEARQVGQTGYLRAKRPMDYKSILSFNMSHLYQQLRDEIAPNAIHMLQALATSHRVKEHTEQRCARTEKVVYSSYL